MALSAYFPSSKLSKISIRYSRRCKRALNPHSCGACTRTVIVYAWPCSGFWRVAMASVDCATRCRALGPPAHRTTPTIWAPCACACARRQYRRFPASYCRRGITLRACLRGRVGKHDSGSSSDSSEDGAVLLLRSWQVRTTLALPQKLEDTFLISCFTYGLPSASFIR
jgi:hypothetical protein